MNNKTLLSLLVMLVSGFIIGSSPSKADPLQSESVVTEWQTFTEPGFGYQIDYPSDWHVALTADNTMRANAYGEDVVLRSIGFFGPQSQIVFVDVRQNSSGLLLDQWIEKYPLPIISSNEHRLLTAQRSLAGNIAKETTLTPLQPGVETPWHHTTQMMHDDLVFNVEYVTLTADVAVYEAMLTSFQLIEPTQSRSAPSPAKDIMPPVEYGVAVATCCGISDTEYNPFPCNSAQGMGNCTWWARYARRGNNEANLYNCTGNANTWDECATQYYPHLLSDTPFQSSVIVWMGASDNHVAYIESMISATQYQVSQMGWTQVCPQSYYNQTHNSSKHEYIHHPDNQGGCCGCVASAAATNSSPLGGELIGPPSPQETAVATLIEPRQLDGSVVRSVPEAELKSNTSKPDEVSVWPTLAWPTTTNDAAFSDIAENESTPVPVTVRADLNTAPPSSANYRLARSVMSMGGGTKTSSSYVLRGTSGQPFATGLRTSSNYRLNSGYWGTLIETTTTPTPTPTPTATPTQTPTPTPTATATTIPGGAKITISPATQTVGLTGQVCVQARVEKSPELHAFEFTLGFPPDLLEATSATLGSFLGSTGRTLVTLPADINNATGRVKFGAATIGAAPGATGNGDLAAVCFTPKKAGTAALDVLVGKLSGPNGATIPVSLSGGSVTITSCYFADFDCNNEVDILDVQQIAGRWGKSAGDPGFEARYDVVPNGEIDILDIQKVASAWGWPNNRQTPRVSQAPTALSFSIDPAQLELAVGETRQIALKVTGAQNLGAFEIKLHYDGALIRVNSVRLTDFLESTGRQTFVLGPEIDNPAGQVRFGAATIGWQPGVTGDGQIALIEVTALAVGDGALDLHDGRASDPAAVPITVSLIDGSYQISEGTIGDEYSLMMPVILRRR